MKCTDPLIKSESFPRERFVQFLPVLFLVILLMSFPYRFLFSMDQYRMEELFSRTALAVTALSFLVFSLPGKFSEIRSIFSCRKFAVPFVLLFLLPVFSVSGLFKMGSENFFLPLYYLSLPLFSCVFAEEFRKLLPGVLAWTGTILFAVTFFGIIFLPLHYFRIVYGLPGNRNWNSALLLACLPFVLYHVYQFCREKKGLSKLKTCLCLLVVCFVSLFVFYHTSSLGSAASLCAVLFFVLLFLLPDKYRKKVLIFSFVSGIILAVCCTFFFKEIETKLGRSGSMGERVELLASAVQSLFCDTPLAGNSFASIEQSLSSNRRKSYFKVLNPAIRSTHPHNHFLYAALGWGALGGLLLWGGFLLILPVVKSFFLLAEEKNKIKEKLLFLSFISLFAHAQVDLILEIWPCGAICLLLLGLNWEKGFCMERMKEEKGREKEKTLSKKVRIFCWIFGGIFLLYPLFLAGKKAYIMYGKEILFHSAQPEENTRKQLTDLLAFLNPSDPTLLYDLMLLSLRKQDPHTALFLSDLIGKGPVPDYGRIHYARGQIFLMLGRIDESLSEYQKDAVLFPSAVLPVYNMIQIAGRNQKVHMLELLQKEFAGRLEFLRISKEEFAFILANPACELAPWRGDRMSVYENWKKRFIEK